MLVIGVIGQTVAIIVTGYMALALLLPCSLLIIFLLRCFVIGARCLAYFSFFSSSLIISALLYSFLCKLIKHLSFVEIKFNFTTNSSNSTDMVFSMLYSANCKFSCIFALCSTQSPKKYTKASSSAPICNQVCCCLAP